MSIVNLFKTSISSLKFHKLRTFLTMIGIIIGISSVVAILAVGDGFKDYVIKSTSEANANKININFIPENKSADMKLIEPFNKGDLDSIKNISGVEKVQPSQGFGMGSYSYGNISFFNKTEMALLDSYDSKNNKVEYGRWFRKGDEDRKNIVLEYKVAEKLFDSAKDAIGTAVVINGDNYEVIGVLPKVEGISFSSAPSSFISKKAKEGMTSNENIYSIDVFVKAGHEKKKVFNDVNKYLKANHGNLEGKYELNDPEEVTKVFEKIIGGLTTFIAFITGISLLVGGIGVMNIMYVSVSERKREIGIRRAIGAKPRSILLQFLLEAIVVTVLGGLVGILFGYLIAKIAGAFLPFSPVLTLGTFIGATLVSIIEGIVFGIIPAYNACKLDPIKAIYK